MNLSLPETWQTTKLTELAIYVLGGDWGKDANFESADYTIALCIRGAEFRNWNENKGSTASPRKIKKSSLANRILKDGDILVEISGGGPDQPVGRTVLIDKVALSQNPNIPKICTNFVRLLRITREIDSRFINSYLTFFYASGDIRDYQAGSNNLRNLKFNDYLGIDIPIPPLNEQYRIVAKIEELFSELDKGIENLKTAQAQIKVYRQALLKNAFEGKLTAQWRTENKDKLEAAEALLKRIQQERAQRYQQQLADWEFLSKQGSKPKAPKPLPPLTAEELIELPELPNEWAYAYLSDLGDLGRGKSKHRPRNDPQLFGGIYPFIQTGEVKAANRIIRQYTQTLSEFGLQQSKLWPAGTLCITIAANIAETAFLGFDGCFPDSVVGFSAFKTIIAPEYVDFFIQSARTRIEAYAPATAQKNINLETLENLVVPYCCQDEQKQILNILEERFSILDQLNQSITTSLQHAEALRQSILKKAFSGQLVPQDPNDEPATELFARIRTEREQVNSPKRERKSA